VLRNCRADIRQNKHFTFINTFTVNTMNAVNIDSHKVEANDSLITGNNNVIFGNNNRVVGNRNKIYGNNNEVIGNENVIKGEHNRAHGDGNEICAPFGAPTAFPSVSDQPTSPVSIPVPTIDSAEARRRPMNSYTPPPVSPRSYEQPRPTSPYATSSYEQPRPTSPYGTSPYEQPRPTSPYGTSPVNYSSMSTSPMNNPYFQPISQAIVPVHQAIVPFNAPQPYLAVTPYVNPFSTPVPEPNPFEVYRQKEKEKEKDVIQDGTMVFMIKEWESDYIREFCQLVSMTSGQKVSWHVSCGRTCVVGLGDLEKIRAAIIELLPQLNMRLREWSWNSFGKKVCENREVYEKRLFKEYTREDVEVWRNNSPSASKVAA